MQRLQGWEFLFLAAGRDAIREASWIGINDGHAYAFDASPEGVEQSLRVLSATSLRQLRRRRQGNT